MYLWMFQKHKYFIKILVYKKSSKFKFKDVNIIIFNVERLTNIIHIRYKCLILLLLIKQYIFITIWEICI